MIELGFRNNENKVEFIHIKPDDTEISNLWLSQLDSLLKNHQEKIYQKNFSLLGFENNYRTIKHICDDLDRSISIINKNSNYKIIEDYSILRSTYDQELLNILHHHFEVMQGQLWSPGQELSLASGETRLSICFLNHCCHELEAWFDTINKNNVHRNGYFYYNLLGITNRIDLDLKFKKQFTKDVYDGMVYLHYAQTGKTWYEAYLDNDDVVNSAGISEHRVISGEFNCYFGPGYTFPTDQQFSSWLLSKGIDPTDEQLALGYAPVGNIQGLPHHDAKDFFKEYSDFYSIDFNNTKVVYNYRHTDQLYLDRLSEMWNKWNSN